MQPVQRSCVRRWTRLWKSLPISSTNCASDPRVRRKGHIMYHWQGIDSWIDSRIVLLLLLGSRSRLFMPFMRLLAGTILALAEEVRPFATVAYAMVIPNQPRRFLQKTSDTCTCN